MFENAQSTSSMQADIDRLREQFPRTSDLYREACAVMFFRYGVAPTTNALYQLVRKGSMSVPAEALKRFWSDLRERARVDLQHADLPDQVKQSAGQLIGEIWSLAQKAADDSITALRQSATAERDAVLAEKAGLENKVTQLSARLEEDHAQISTREATIKKQREELSSAAAAQQESDLRLIEARADIGRLRNQINSMLSARAVEIEKLTNRVLQAEQRYSELTKRTLVDLDRERTAASKLQKQIDAERRTSAFRIEEIKSEVQAAQLKLARQSQELGTCLSKAVLLVEERDRATSQAMGTRFSAANWRTNSPPSERGLRSYVDNSSDLLAHRNRVEGSCARHLWHHASVVVLEVRQTSKFLASSEVRYRSKT